MICAPVKGLRYSKFENAFQNCSVHVGLNLAIVSQRLRSSDGNPSSVPRILPRASSVPRILPRSSHPRSSIGLTIGSGMSDDEGNLGKVRVPPPVSHPSLNAKYCDLIGGRMA